MKIHGKRKALRASQGRATGEAAGAPATELRKAIALLCLSPDPSSELPAFCKILASIFALP